MTNRATVSTTFNHLIAISIVIKNSKKEKKLAENIVSIR